MRLSHLPLRVTTGAFMLNSGLGKRDLEGGAAEGVHGMASAAIPALKRFDAKAFGQLLSGAEIAIGVALLAPVVPATLAGASLTAFASGLMRLYWKTPGMHPEGDPRPTHDGIGLAKDVWLVGAGLTLLLDGVADRRAAA